VDLGGAGSGAALLDREQVAVGSDCKRERVVRLMEGRRGVQRELLISTDRGEDVDLGGLGPGAALLDREQIAVGGDRERERGVRFGECRSSMQ
jgi:hypothetical protein